MLPASLKIPDAVVNPAAALAPCPRQVPAAGQTAGPSPLPPGAALAPRPPVRGACLPVLASLLPSVKPSAPPLTLLNKAAVVLQRTLPVWQELQVHLAGVQAPPSNFVNVLYLTNKQVLAAGVFPRTGVPRLGVRRHLIIL